MPVFTNQTLDSLSLLTLLGAKHDANHFRLPLFFVLDYQPIQSNPIQFINGRHLMVAVALQTGLLTWNGLVAVANKLLSRMSRLHRDTKSCRQRMRTARNYEVRRLFVLRGRPDLRWLHMSIESNVL